MDDKKYRIMKKIIIAIGIIVGILGMFIAYNSKSQSAPTIKNIKLKAGIFAPAGKVAIVCCLD